LLFWLFASIKLTQFFTNKKNPDVIPKIGEDILE